MESRNGSLLKINHFTLALWLTVVGAGAAQRAQAQKPSTPAVRPAAASADKASTAAATDNSAATPGIGIIYGRGTAYTIPIFTSTHVIQNSLVTQTGNGITVNGTVGAVSFSGDGSGLSNVNASTLGGVGASSFAQQGASNNFTADQTITGNLNLTGYINSAFSFQGNLTDQNGQEGANVLGGFVGNSAFAGNSIAPGTIGATIGGGGGAYDPSLLPRHPARKKIPRRSGSGVDSLRNPFARRSPLQSSSEQSAETEQEPPPGLISGGNSVTNNPITPCCPSWATIAGGLRNTASGFAATVGGGFGNTSSGNYSTVAGGDVNSASAQETTVAGGTGNAASDVDSTVGGGYQNTASGFGDGYGSSTVAGGYQNTASGDDSTVGGGYQNTASGNSSEVSFIDIGKATVAGGLSNTASGNLSTIGGGGANTASGDLATVSGGGSPTGVGYGENTASGYASMVPGGSYNSAAGEFSFAAGCFAIANYASSFVWNGSNTCVGVQDTAASQFVAAAPGGFYFYTSQNGSLGSGATLPSGSGSWSSLSDRNAKANFLAIDPSSLLKKLAAMPVATWNYKTQDDSIRHLGPTAQDFHEAFGLGEDDKHISTVDAEGVALAGIQALYQTVTVLQRNLAELRSTIADKDQQIAELRERLSHVEESAGRN